MHRRNPQLMGYGPRGHELVDHTSEVTIRVPVPSFPELIVESTRAFVGPVPESHPEMPTA